MNRFLLVAIALISCTASFAQKVPLINSGEVIDQAKVLYDSGKYDAAISKFLTVPKRDTNYVYMLTELALSYLANEQYDKAIATCDEGLKTRNTNRPHLLKSKCIALDKKGSYVESVNLFKKSIDEYPLDYRLIYNLGITYYNNKEHEKAVDCFFQVLALNPFHSGSHLNLGRISIGQGRKTHGMLAFGMYLGISNEDNSRLVQLDKFLSNQIEEEGALKASDVNACEKMDQIIRSKVALDKNFKSKLPLDAPVVKQYEMFFQQLNILPATSDDRWLTYYLPIYKAIRDQNMTETFLYHILSSASNEQVKKWRQKNEKQLKAFYSVANTEMARHRKVITAPVSLGFDKPVQAWYDDNNKCEALGQKEGEDKRIGKWLYFHDTMERSAEGVYNSAGEKIGVWKYYYTDGAVKSIEDYGTGEVTVYYQDGPKSQHFFLKNDMIHGDVELYFNCGGLKEKLAYVNGDRHGSGVLYYPDGTKDLVYQYTNGKLKGEYLSYYANGKLFSKSIYTDGVLDGLYSEYHANGKLRLSGAYAKDAVHGTWKYYYINGQLEKTGSYVNGQPNGEWSYYDANGVLTEKRIFNAAGEWHGDNTFYHDGKLHGVQTFKNDMLVKVVYYDKQGKELGKFEGSNGTFAAKTYYAHGQLHAVGSYRKGKMDGVWKHYYPEGSLMNEYTYVEGKADGPGVEYFRNGTKKFILPYQDDKLHGYFTEFFSNGKVKYEGWYQEGDHQQQWLSYYPDGTLESDYYYLHDNLEGEYFDYTASGELLSVLTYKTGRIKNLELYNSKTEKLVKVRDEGNRKIYETKFPNGKNKLRNEISCGNYSGTQTKWYPDGKVFLEYGMMTGRRHGNYNFYGIGGSVEVTGQYVNGSEEGEWKWYYSNGTLDYVGKYLDGEYDSTWTYFLPNGKVYYTVQHKDSKRHGITAINSPEGTPLLEKLYENGNLISYRTVKPDGQFGEWTAFNPKGSIIATYANGTKAYEENYKDGLTDGAKRVYYSSGKIFTEYFYKAGDFEGPFKVYYPNGNIFEKGMHKNDELEGVHETYNEDGSLYSKETYLTGTRHGVAELYSKGVVVKSFTFFGGSPEK